MPLAKGIINGKEVEVEYSGRLTSQKIGYYNPGDGGELVEMKYCGTKKGCGLFRELGEFCRSRRTSTGLRTHCRLCRTEHNRKSRQKNKGKKAPLKQRGGIERGVLEDGRRVHVRYEGKLNCQTIAHYEDEDGEQIVLKYCGGKVGCGSFKPLSFFHNKSRSSSGLHSHCKDCNNKNSTEWKRGMGMRLRSVYRQNKNLCVYLKGGRCALCETDDENTKWNFHHLARKKYTIANLIHNDLFNYEYYNRLIDELNKTVLLCVNCHQAIHDYTRRMGGTKSYNNGTQYAASLDEVKVFLGNLFPWEFERWHEVLGSYRPEVLTFSHDHCVKRAEQALNKKRREVKEYAAELERIHTSGTTGGDRGSVKQPVRGSIRGNQVRASV